MSASSESDGDAKPISQSRPRTRRGLAKQISSDCQSPLDVNPSSENSIYTNQVSRLNSVAATKRVQRKEVYKEPLSRDLRKKTAEQDCDGNSTVSSYEQNEPLKIDEVCAEVKDPTPPSTPKRVAVKKGKRMKRGVKAAMNALQKMKKTMNENDDDIMIVDSVDPCQTIDGHSFAIKIRLPSGVKKFQIKPYAKGSPFTLTLYQGELTDHMHFSYQILAGDFSHRPITGQFLSKVTFQNGVEIGSNTDSFARVFSSIAATEDVDENNIFMVFNDSTVHIYDSPNALGITVADILDCHINSSQDCLSPVPMETVGAVEDRMLIRLNLQMKDSRSKTSLSIRKDEPMEKLMREFCRTVGKDFGTLKFCFDGESVELSATPQSLDLEADYCIDVLKR